MNNLPNITRLIQAHKSDYILNYDLTVDWAIELMNLGIENENILILASFSKPVDSWEIKSYVSSVLHDLGLEEREGDSAKISIIEYCLNEILNDRSVRKNLDTLYELCLKSDYEFGLMPFYLLYHGWTGLEELGVNCYYEGADETNIGQALKKEAKLWIDNYINN